MTVLSIPKSYATTTPPTIGEINEALELGFKFLNRLYDEISSTEAIMRDYPATPLRVHRVVEGFLDVSHMAGGYDCYPCTTPYENKEYCQIEAIDYTHSRYKFELTHDNLYYDGYVAEDDPDWDFDDLILYVTYEGYSEKRMKLTVTIERLEEGFTVDIYFGSILLWDDATHANEGETITKYIEYGQPSWRYTIRHGAKIAANLYEAVGLTSRANKLIKVWNDNGYTKDIYDPLFGKSNNYPDDFLDSSECFHDADVYESGNWFFQPFGIDYYPYKSRIIFAPDIYLMAFQCQNHYKLLKALHLMNKYGNQEPYISQAKQLIDETGWDGVGCSRTYYIDGVPITYPGYITHHTACFLAAAAKYASLTGDQEYWEKAHQAARVLLDVQIKSSDIYTDDYGWVKRPDYIGGWMTGYMPTSPEYKWVNVGGLGGTEILFKILEYYGIFEPTPSETPTPPMTSQEPTILAMQALRIYKQLYYQPEEISSFNSYTTYAISPNLASASLNGEAKLYVDELNEGPTPYPPYIVSGKSEVEFSRGLTIEPNQPKTIEIQFTYDGVFERESPEVGACLAIEAEVYNQTGLIDLDCKQPEHAWVLVYESETGEYYTRMGGERGGVAYLHLVIPSSDNQNYNLKAVATLSATASMFNAGDPDIDFYYGGKGVKIRVKVYNGIVV